MNSTNTSETQLEIYNPKFMLMVFTFVITQRVPTKVQTVPQCIPYKILYLIEEVIAAPLAEILNLSLETELYIDELIKTSRVLPIFKVKRRKLSSENYRPISLLSNINKIFKKIKHERVYEYLEKQNKMHLTFC